ncbi:MAG: hypothetical protein HRU30_09145, partial [Rhodobacteraceae bacterium]|nr:hypothetical protein [Paracoccaceae bacterium]
MKLKENGQGTQMQYDTLDAALKEKATMLKRGPVAIVFVEDDVEVDTTLRHLELLSFTSILAFVPERIKLAKDLQEAVHQITWQQPSLSDAIAAINKIIAAAPGLWMYYCFNAEYLFFPFCETRKIGELLAFHTEERRDAMLTYVADLYSDDLNEHPNAVSLDRAHLDRSGYYALARADDQGHPKERQLNFYGGLRWRYEEHVPEGKRKIDRVALFKSKPGLKLREDFTFSDEEYNTYACPWHNNLTATIASFRTA